MSHVRWLPTLDRPYGSRLHAGLRDRALAFRENTDYAIVLAIPGGFVHTTQFSNV